MAVTFVQKTEGSDNSTATTATVTITATTGNTVYIVVWRQPQTGEGASTISSVVGSVNGAYTLIPGATVTIATTGHYDHLYLDVYSTTAVSSSADTVTATFSIAVGAILGAYESTAGVLDQVATNTGNSDTASAGNITTTVAGCFSIAVNSMDNGFGFPTLWWTAGSGWTLGNENGGGNRSGADEYQNVAAAGTITGDFVPVHPTFTGPWIALILDFKPAGAPPSGPAIYVARNQILVPGPRRTQIIQM